MLIDEYRTSLKHPEAEEVFDLVFFRPLGFLLARAMVHSRITPNEVTAISLVFGLGAAGAFGLGTETSFLVGATAYAIANLLDCTDGQLARLQRSGTPLGRIWDGIADYIVTVAVFAALGVASGNWGLVVGAGLSSALHAALFDYYQNAFIAARSGNSNFLENERLRYGEEIRRQASRVKILLVHIYLLYIRIEHLMMKFLPAAGATGDAMIRLWSLLGPTTNRTALIVCALFGEVEFFLWMIALGGNIWMIVCLTKQHRSGRAFGRQTLP